MTSISQIMATALRDGFALLLPAWPWIVLGGIVLGFIWLVLSTPER